MKVINWRCISDSAISEQNLIEIRWIFTRIFTENSSARESLTQIQTQFASDLPH